MSTVDPFANLEDYENDIGLGDEDKDKVKSNKLEWYKGDKGRTDRVALLYFNTQDMAVVKRAKQKNPELTSEQVADLVVKTKKAIAEKLGKSVDQLSPVDLLNLNECRFKLFKVHYQEGLGYLLSRLGMDGPEGDAVWSKLPSARQYVSTLLLIYPTDKEGNIDKARLRNGYRFQPWRMAEDKYHRIRKLNAGLVENGITVAGQDLLLSCKEAQYQQIDINLAGPALWFKDPEMRREVLLESLKYYSQLSPGREMTTAELRAKLGLAPVVAGADVGGDFQHLIDQV